jgi:purine-nucleoside phosphorylase
MPFVPQVGIILGTGYSGWSDTLNKEHVIETSEIPHFIPPRVASHKGQLSFTTLGQTKVAMLAGRIHYYEGYDMEQVVRPIRILHALGCTHLVITNAAGGINPTYEAGDIVLIRDHINLMGVNPLRGPNETRWGPRVPDMMRAYDPVWIDFTQKKAKESGLKIATGVYAGNAGPSMETPAEYEYLHRIGADLVGMSAVPEVITAHHMSMKILAISVVSNVCYPPERVKETTVEEVIRVVQSSASNLGDLVSAALTYCTTI